MQKLTLATLSTLAFTLSSTNVFALDGTLTVNGVVTDQTCVLLAKGFGGGQASGVKDITINFPAMPKSWFVIPNQWQRIENFKLYLRNATDTGPCDAATTKAFKGIHLSVTSPDHLDATDKTLLVNQAEGASATNPIFMQIIAVPGGTIVPVDFSAPWGGQAKSSIVDEGGNNISLHYFATVLTKTGVVDAQNYTAKINYTIHYN
ncbi:fimbrial protein [Acinetobacter sp.]|uniref:fimbrial protein n=1 Tax=Acinetobacter sp. TaxID=472 RepID=UPI003981E01E